MGLAWICPPSWGFSGRHSIGASNATFASYRASILLLWIWAFRVPYGFSGFWSCPWTGPAWGGWNISSERISTAPWPLLFSFTLNLLLHFGHFFSMEVTAWINGVTGIDFGFPFLLGGWWSRGCWGAAIGALFIQRKEVLGLWRSWFSSIHIFIISHRFRGYELLRCWHRFCPAGFGFRLGFGFRYISGLGRFGV